MELENMLKNIETSTDAELKASQEFYKNLPEEGEQPVPPAPVDIYQQTQDHIYDVGQKSFPRGSSPIVNAAVASVIDGAGAEGLARAYKRAKDDCESLMDKGERGRAQLLRRQYMQEYFLPAVEVVVNSASPDDLLANKKALDELDKYALLEGSGKGYTATYVRQAYGNQLGQVQGRSDDFVSDGVRKINMLLDDGEVRAALSIANSIKKKIEDGEAVADDNDAELIGRVVAYFDKA